MPLDLLRQWACCMGLAGRPALSGLVLRTSWTSVTTGSSGPFITRDERRAGNV